MPLTVSIVVPTYRRPHWLGPALASLASQQVPSDITYDVWVSDNNSGDETEQVVRYWAARSSVPLHYVCETKPGDAPTRNRGIHESGLQEDNASEYVAFFDDDQFAVPTWLTELVRTARQTGAGVVGGPVRLDIEPATAKRLGSICRGELREIEFSDQIIEYQGKQLPGTGNALVRRDLIERLGRFDESFTAGGSDSDFFLRARAAGEKMLYVPKAPIIHRLPTERTTPAYFRWNALSSGAEHLAHFDFEHHGKVGLVARCLARLGQATLVNLPLYAVARVTGNDGMAMGRRTLLWRCEGYVRRTLRTLFPGSFPQADFFAALDMRAGRTVGVVDESEPTDGDAESTPAPTEAA